MEREVRRAIRSSSSAALRPEIVLALRTEGRARQMSGAYNSTCARRAAPGAHRLLFYRLESYPFAVDMPYAGRGRVGEKSLLSTSVVMRHMPRAAALSRLLRCCRFTGALYAIFFFSPAPMPCCPLRQSAPPVPATHLPMPPML